MIVMYNIFGRMLFSWIFLIHMVVNPAWNQIYRTSSDASEKLLLLVMFLQMVKLKQFDLNFVLW